MAGTLRLNRQPQESGSLYGRTGYRIVFYTESINGFPKEVFRYIRRPCDPGNPGAEAEDVFSGVVTLEELASLPLNNPRPNEEPQYMRSDRADLIIPSEAMVNDVQLNLVADISSLINAKNLSDRLSQAESIEI